MKKSFFVLSFVLFIILSVSGQDTGPFAENNFFLDRSDSETTELSFKLTDYELEEVIEDGSSFMMISCDNAGEFALPGLPDLPRFTRLIAVPDQGIVNVQITDSQSEIISDIAVYPRQQLQSESSRTNDEFFIDNDYYRYGEIFPQQPVTLGEPVILRDFRLVSLTINPFQYDPVNRQLKITTSIKVTVSTEAGSGSNSKVSTGKKSRFFEPLYESVIFNYEDFAGRDYEYQEPSYLFIYPNNTQVWGYLESLVDWKHEKGFIVNAVSTAETGTTSNDILDYLTFAYNTWENPPEFVCLIGDAGGSFNIPTGHMNGGEGDHFYTMLEGNDILSDIFIGRLSFNSTTQFQTILTKIFNYEKEPFTELTDWYDKVLLVGDPSSSGPSTVDTKRHVKDMINYYSPNLECTEVYSGSYTTQITNNINAGVSYFNYRGFGGMSGWNTNYINNLSNGFMLPVAIALTCNTGDFEGTYDSINEAFLKAGSPSTPRGAIAAISTATGQTHTCFNNCMDAGIYYGFFADGLHITGGALNRGKLNLYMNYPDNPGNQVMNFSYWNNLMGDPGLEIWTSQPQPLNVEYQTDLPAGTNYIEITVEDDNGQPVNNAWVTVLKGNDEIFATDFTSADGTVVLPLNSASAGEVKLTVTKHDFVPHLGNFTLSIEDQFVSLENVLIDDDNSGSSSGNADNLINPGEIIELNLSLQNHGSSDVSGINAYISSENELISISNSASQFGNIAAGNSAVSTNPFIFIISEAANGGSVIRFELLISDEARNQWHETFFLPVAGPVLSPLGLNIFDNGNSLLEAGETAELSCIVTNLGLSTVTNVYGTLSCDNQFIDILDDNGYFGDLPPDTEISNDVDRFEISASTQVFDGIQIPLQLQLYNAAGFEQVIHFNLQIGEVDSSDPLGPDAFGYYCYDDEDTSYEAPAYNWIEISTTEGGSGTEIDLYDAGDMGDVETIDLPFNLKFYDLDYTTISVCSNGWLSPGSTANESFMNWNIPGPLGPSPLIAPFWDDLITTTGDVSYFYDATEHIFIIEWNNLQNQYNYNEETFQVVIFDNYYYPVSNGNNKILFQYKEVNNVDQGSYSGWTIQHGQYATVGLEDHTATRGIEYTFNNFYPTAAKPLQDEMAILFTGPPIYQDDPFILIGGLEMEDENENGVADYGEDIDLYISLNNLGNNSAYDVSAQLFIDDPYVTIISNTSQYPEIPGGGMIGNLTPFALQISPDCPDNHVVQADLNVVEQIAEWDLHFTFLLHAPVVVFGSVLVNDGFNSILDPGETADIIINLQNTGGASTYDGTFTIATEDEFLTINEASYEINDLPAEGSATAILNVTAADSASIGHQCQINWTFSASQEYYSQGNFPLVISLVPVYVTETFEEFPPQDWSITPNSNWTQGTWNQSGGTPPEAQFNWYPQSNGEQRLISEPVNTLGSLALNLEFKQSVSHFSGNYNLLIQTSSDGTNWNDAHSYPAANQSPTTENITISTPDVGSDNFRFAFCFSGDSYNINNWWIDDVILSSTESDLYGYLTGMILLEGGNSSVEDVQIRVGNYSINPDVYGHFLLPLPVGIYNVTAELYGYATAYENDVEIIQLETTDVNLTLIYLIAPVGLETEVTGNDVELNWSYPEAVFLTCTEKPEQLSSSADNRKALRDLTGFNIYRNDIMIDQIQDPEIRIYPDMDLLNGEYTYFITAQYSNGESGRSNDSTVLIDFNDLTDDQIVLNTQLNSNFPNPFNPETVISYQLAENSLVKLQIYNVKGQLVRDLVNMRIEPGLHTATWSGKDNNGAPVKSGIYFYKLKTEYHTSVRKMILMQ